MNTKLTAFVAVVVTGFCATFLGAFTTTPEVLTQLVVGVSATLASGIVVLVLMWTPWFGALRPERQRRATWIAACGTGLLMAFLPMLLSLSR